MLILFIIFFDHFLETGEKLNLIGDNAFYPSNVGGLVFWKCNLRGLIGLESNLF